MTIPREFEFNLFELNLSGDKFIFQFHDDSVFYFLPF